jgi:hypothetical protein
MENAMSNNSVAIIVRSIEGRGIQIEVSVLGGVVNLEVKHIPLAPGDQYVDPPFRMTIGGPVGQPGVRDFDEACPMRAAPLEHRLEVKEPRVCAKIMPDVMREYGVSDRLGGDRYWCGRARGHDGSCGDWVYGSQPKHFEAML